MGGNDNKKPLKKKIIEILGYLVSIVALYFVYKYVVNIDLEAAKQKLSLSWIPLLLLFISILRRPHGSMLSFQFILLWVTVIVLVTKEKVMLIL